MEEQLREFIIAALEEFDDDPLMDRRKREAAQSGTKSFLFRLGLRLPDEQMHAIYKNVFNTLLKLAQEIDQVSGDS